MSVEEFARILHEAGRQAVKENKVVRKDVPNKGFIEWDQLDKDAKEGRILQARWIMDRYLVEVKPGLV